MIAPEPPLLSLRCVRVRFGAITALDLAALDVAGHAGPVALFMGPNGAGKTTLLNAVTGYVPVLEGGRITLAANGVDLARVPRSSIVRAGVGRTFQDPPVFPSLSIRESVSLALASSSGGPWWRTAPRWLCAADRLPARGLVDALLDQLGLARVADMPSRDLPLHLLRRAALARCLAAQPRLVMLDEPSAGGDDKERRLLVSLVCRDIAALSARLHSAGLYRHRAVSVCVVTHDLDLAHDVARSAAVPPLVHVLDGGRLLASGSLDEVTSDRRIRETYLGEGGSC